MNYVYKRGKVAINEGSFGCLCGEDWDGNSHQPSCLGEGHLKVWGCKTCGEPTMMGGTRLCNNCCEVESRLSTYAHSPKGRENMLALLAQTMPVGRAQTHLHHVVLATGMLILLAGAEVDLNKVRLGVGNGPITMLMPKVLPKEVELRLRSLGWRRPEKPVGNPEIERTWVLRV